MITVKIKTNVLVLTIAIYLTLVSIVWANLGYITFAQMNFTSNNSSTASSDSIPTAQSVYETGVMELPTSVRSAIIFIPDEAHHPPADDKTISPKNPNYLPNILKIPEGTDVAFVHDDPGHTHVGIVKDKDGIAIWTTIPVKFPDGSDTKILRLPGSPYNISDEQYSPPMEGKIIVTPGKSTGSLTVGGLFCPTNQLTECKSQLSKAAFQVLSEHNFETKSVQKDIAGSNTLLIYSTVLPLKDAITSLGPIIKSLPYK